MAFTITIEASGRQFTVNDDETILQAALRNQIHLPYGCQNGGCGSCKGTVKNGEFEIGTHSSSALSDEERSNNLTLLCRTHAKSDLTISVPEIQGMNNIPIKKLPCRIHQLEKKADDVMVVHLQLPTNQPFQYLAGQYIDFLLKDGSRRSYSIANAPHHEGPIELHIRHFPGGLFTDHVFSTMKERDILRFEGPLGTFFFREDSNKPIVLLASGTGFAPIKAIVEQMIEQKCSRPTTLYWGARTKQDLYMLELAEQWSHLLAQFTFVPVLSESHPQDTWQGKTGFVHHAVLADFSDLSGYEVYACGTPVMVQSAQKDFIEQRNLPQDAFYSDAFTTAADLAK